MEVDRELVHNAIGKQSLENLEVQDDNGNDTESNVHKPLAFVNNNQSTATRLSTDSTDTKNVETTLGTPPSISSQFSNVLTKSETRKGVQKNPRRMLKKPKVTYGRRKQQQSANLVVEKKALKQLTLPVVVQPKRKNVDDENGEYAVFDFCSGDCGKEQTVETPTTAAAMSLSSDQQADENKLISPRLNVRRSRSKRRRINMAASKKSKRSVDTAVPGQKIHLSFNLMCKEIKRKRNVVVVVYTNNVFAVNSTRGSHYNNYFYNNINIWLTFPMKNTGS